MDSQTKKTIVGNGAAWIGTTFLCLSLSQSIMTAVCAYLYNTDHGPVDHQWNCGVLIHGVYSVIDITISAMFYAVSVVTHRASLQSVMSKQIESIRRAIGRIKPRK